MILHSLYTIVWINALRKVRRTNDINSFSRKQRVLHFTKLSVKSIAPFQVTINKIQGCFIEFFTTYKNYSWKWTQNIFRGKHSLFEFQLNNSICNTLRQQNRLSAYRGNLQKQCLYCKLFGAFCAYRTMWELKLLCVHTSGAIQAFYSSNPTS